MPPHQLALDFPHAAAMGSQDFIRSNSNALAADALDAWPNWPRAAQGLRAYALHGPRGCGKTHLAAIWATRVGAQWVDVGALATRAAADPHYRATLALDAPVRVVCDGLNGAPPLTAAAEETLFHLYNALAERDGFLLLTGDTPPARLALPLRDLATRLGTITTLPVAWPDEALIHALFTKLLSDRQLRAPATVISFLASRIERTPTAVQRCVEALDRASLARGRAITVPLARDVLAAVSDPSKARD